MKKLSLFLCAVMCLSLFTVMPASAAKLSANAHSFTEEEATLFLNENAADIVPNGGFEYTTDGTFVAWGVSCNESQNGVQQNFIGSENCQLSSDAHSGAYSMRLKNSVRDDASTFLRQGFAITAGVTYEMTFWAKGIDLDENAEALFRGSFSDADGSSTNFGYVTRTIHNTSLNLTISTETWTRFGIRFTAPEGAVKFGPYFYMNGKGSYLVDDLVILAPKEYANTVKSSAKKQPVLTEDSSALGPVYIVGPDKGSFEQYAVGDVPQASANPGGHNGTVSDAYNHTEGGSKSLYFKNNTTHGDFQPNFYVNELKLVPGATYQASTWILAPEPGTSADFSYWFNFTMSDGSSDQKKKHYGIKHYGWWQEVCFDFVVPMDSSNVTASLQIRMMADNQEYYVDDFYVYMVERPPFADVVTDELFYYTEWEEGTVSANPTVAFKDALNGGKAVYTFLDTDGVSVLETKEVSYNNYKANYVFKTSLMAEKGIKYYVNAKIYNSAGEMVQEETRGVYRYDRPTYLGADGKFHKNGKEYNIVMGSGVTTELLEADPRRGGITVVRLVADGTSLKSRMDKAHEMGLLCLIGLYGTTSGGHPNAIESTINTVNSVKDHPALFGYKVQDEPYQKGTPESELEAAYVAIRNNDPHHPVYVVDSVAGGYDWLFRFNDYVDIDYYGGGGSDSGREIYNKIQIANAASKGRKPFALMQQVFQYESYLPTIDELRNMAFQNFFAGATGLSYHSLGVDGSDGVTQCYMYMEDWNELCRKWATFEQGFMLDCFVNMKYPMLRAYSDNNAMWRTYLKDGKIYLIAYNRQKNAGSNISVPLSSLDGTINVGNFTATRLTGGDWTEKSFSGTNTFSITLGGITARERGMNFVQLGGLSAEIWEITPHTPITVSPAVSSFTDFEKVSWAYQGLAELEKAGIIYPTISRWIGVGENVTRGEFAEYLINALALTGSGESFDDVSMQKSYALEVAIGKKLGIFTSVSGNNFNPDSVLTRADMMTMVSRAVYVKSQLLKGESASLSSVSSQKLASLWVTLDAAYSVRLNLIRGVNNGAFSDSGNVTRAEAAAIFAKLLSFCKNPDNMTYMENISGNLSESVREGMYNAFLSGSWSNVNSDKNFKKAKFSSDHLLFINANEASVSATDTDNNKTGMEALALSETGTLPTYSVKTTLYIFKTGTLSFTLPGGGVGLFRPISSLPSEGIIAGNVVLPTLWNGATLNTASDGKPVLYKREGKVLEMIGGLSNSETINLDDNDYIVKVFYWSSFLNPTKSSVSFHNQK